MLQSMPVQVSLVFSEPVTPAGAGIKVYSPSGREVAGPAASHGLELTAPLAGDEPGTYVVLWQVFAADTHPSRGAFEFSVGSPTGNPFASLLDAPQAGTSTPLGLAAQALARWLHFVGFALAFGLIAYGVLTRAPAASGRLAGAGLLLLVAAEPLYLVAQLASLSFDGDTALAVMGSSFGRVLGLRLGAALLAWALIATRRPWPVLVVGGAVAVLDGATAHAIPAVPVAGQALVAVHVAAMGLWVGGLVGYVRRPDPRFPKYAVGTFGVAIVSGAVLGLVHSRFGTALLTDYGLVLIVKVAAVGVAIVAAILGRRRLELVIAAVAIASATLLASLPPPA